MYGDNGQDLLKGGDGDDVLDGGKGADVMVGGDGDDRYHVNNNNDTIVESIGDGFFDIVISEINYILPTNVEDLKLVGVRSFKGTGNELDNVITGNSLNNTLIGLEGNDKLDGGKGADVMLGGEGSDVYFVDNAKDSIIDVDEIHAFIFGDSVNASVSYTLPAYVEDLFLVDKANLNGFGNNLNNRLSGNDGNNRLSGGLGDDILEGNDGNDVLIGGTGDDILKGDIDPFFQLEVGLIQTSFNNVMRGGSGNDTYFVNSENDVVIESTAITGGIDTVTSFFNYTLPKGVENLNLNFINSSFDFFGANDGNGNRLDNKINGNSEFNTLRGFDGNDTLIGVGGSGDELFGGNGNDLLIGTGLLSGGKDNDTLVSTLDDFNQLIGGAGQDTFSFDINKFTDLGRLTDTEISDFKAGLDVIDLGSIAVSSGHFLSFIGTNAFSSSNADGQVRFDAANHQLLGSIDSDAAPEFAISLLGVNSLSAEDLILK